jgi:hypothetical protein
MVKEGRKFRATHPPVPVCGHSFEFPLILCYTITMDMEKQAKTGGGKWMPEKYVLKPLKVDVRPYGHNLTVEHLMPDGSLLRVRLGVPPPESFMPTLPVKNNV